MVVDDCVSFLLLVGGLIVKGLLVIYGKFEVWGFGIVDMVVIW